MRNLIFNIVHLHRYGGGAAKNAVDGDMHTSYHSNSYYDPTPWFVLDLQDSYEISGIRVYFGARQSHRLYEIKVGDIFFLRNAAALLNVFIYLIQTLY